MMGLDVLAVILLGAGLVMTGVAIELWERT